MEPILNPPSNVNADIFAGTLGTVAVTTVMDQEPYFNDPSFVEITNIINFPTLGMNRAIQTVEPYDSDYEEKLAGNVTLHDTEITVCKIIGDPVQKLLSDAVLNKTELRFRNFYEMEAVDNTTRAGYFQIYDAIPVGEELAGGGDAPVTVTYTLAVTDALLANIIRLGNPLLTGDYGIGAGTTDFPGLVDTTKLSGNRFVQFLASDPANPFGADTAALAGQGSEKAGWQLLVNSGSAPKIRIRSVTDNAQSVWYKVYSENDKPTPNEVQAVALDGSNVMTGRLTTPDIVAVKGKIDTLESASFKVTQNIMIDSGLQSLNQWTMQTDALTELSFVGNNGLTKALALTKDGNARIFNNLTADGGLICTSGVTVNGVKVINNDGTTVTMGGQNQSLMLQSKHNKIQVTDGVNTSLVLTDTNYRATINKTHVRKTGDTMTGTLAVPRLLIHTEENALIGFVSMQDTIPMRTRAATIGQDDTGSLVVTYANAEDETIHSRIKLETGKSGTVYHTGNRPTPADLGAYHKDDVIDLGTF